MKLPDIIKKKLKRKALFCDLLPYDQRSILDYIKKHNIDLKVFKCKWFDILSNKFYSIEYVENGLYGVSEEKREFDSFGSFIDYVRGDIYENTCLYGYRFTQEEINEYSIDIKSLNFDSFVKETINNYSFKKVKSFDKLKTQSAKKRIEEMARFLNEYPPISTFDELILAKKLFKQRFKNIYANDVFFSFVIRKNPDIIKQALLDYVCKYDVFEGITFDKLLVTYGVDIDPYIIEHFNGVCSYATKCRRIRNFKDKVEGIQSGSYMLNVSSRFDPDAYCYRVFYDYQNGVNCRVAFIDSFIGFDEYVSCLNGDLSGADLSKAPVTKEIIKQYKTDTKTKYPPSNDYDLYIIEKKYSNCYFSVKQKWLDGDGDVVLSTEHSFEYIFDFIHFLKGDLSGADLLFCEGIENLKAMPSLIIEGIKVRSDVAEKLGLPIKSLPEKYNHFNDYEDTERNELETVNNLLTEHSEDDDYSGKVSYISDIHLLHRFNANKCKSQEDVDYIIKTISKTIGEQATYITLVGGDTSSDFDIFNKFIESLSTHCRNVDIFFTLGNHELWGMNGKDLNEIVSAYRETLNKYGRGKMHLVQNNLFYADEGWKEISESELVSISPEELRDKTKSARIIIFGGIGFAGMNDDFNADDSIYEDVLDRDREIKESTRFLRLYEKVTESLKSRNLIVLTHMPMKDWGGGDIHAKEKVVYVNGHSHRNYFYDDGRKRIYADNQVGYKGKRLSLKQLSVDFGYEWFSDYKDGIYEITRIDYEKFYRGIGEGISLNREFDKLFMLKREGTYMFLMKNTKGNLLIMNGGSTKKAGNHPIEYYYENLVNYSASVKMFLSDYDDFQKKVSSEIKKIGGDGTIHGSIIDIDFYNHLYLNPLDGKITPYFAYSMTDKYVYDNLPSLLKYERSDLFDNYEKMITKQAYNANALIVLESNLPISKSKTFVESTEIYKVSRILKGLQFTTKYNIVRLWNDSVVDDASKEKGRLIVSSIINPESTLDVVSLPKKIK